MKNTKVFYKVMLILLCVSSFCIIGKAAESTDYTDERFKSFVDPIYEENSDFKVLDSNGSDKTLIFISDTIIYHKSNDYDKIQQYLINKDFTIEQDFSKKITNRAMTNRLYKKYQKSVTFVDTRGKLKDKKGNIYYSISASGTCDNKGKILSYSNAYLTIQSGKGEIKNWEMSDVNCSTTNMKTYLKIESKFVPIYEYVYQGAGVATYKGPIIKNSLNWTPMN